MNNKYYSQINNLIGKDEEFILDGIIDFLKSHNRNVIKYKLYVGHKPAKLAGITYGGLQHYFSVNFFKDGSAVRYIADISNKTYFIDESTHCCPWIIKEKKLCDSDFLEWLLDVVPPVEEMRRIIYG